MLYLYSVEIHTLKLISALYYVPTTERNPFSYREAEGERIFCFELDEKGYLSFEPDKTRLLGNLIFGGELTKDAETAGETGHRFAELPKGNYLFAQQREILSRDDIITLAIEIQREGLWQRLKPGKLLYLRYLFEDGRPVTQLFRPYA
jgi:hypothetical protein